MSKKLTLNVDEKTIEFAHEYAKSTHQSISSLFEKFLNDLKSRNVPKNSLPEKTQRLYGSLENIVIPSKKGLRKLFHEKSID